MIDDNVAFRGVRQNPSMNSELAAGEVLYACRTPRWIQWLVLLAATALMGVLARIILGQEGANLDTGWRIGVAIALAVSTAFVGVSAYRLIRHRPYFVIYEHGFEYSPGGVSTGLVRWTDVVELRDETVLHGDGGFPARRAVTAVVLRNPTEYLARFPRVFRPLMKLRQTMNSSTILIPRGEFGGNDAAVIRMMREQMAKAGSPSR